MGCLINNRGAVLVYVTLFLFVLGILFIALGIDVGWMVYVRSQGQAAVDSAAISGAAAIPAYNSGDPSVVYSIVGSLNSQNTVMNQDAAIANTDVEFCTGDPDTSFTCTAATTPAVGVRVTKTYSTPLFFGKILNEGNPTDITVSAIAWLGGPAGLGPDLPLAICTSQIGWDGPGSTCDPTLLADLSANNVDNAGWFTVPPTSANANDCKNMVMEEMEIPFLYGGQEINLNNGQISACQEQVYYRFEECFESVCPDCCNQSSPSYNPDCVVTLPVIDCDNTINQQSDIVLFASLCITNVIWDPASNATIDATLICDAEAPGSVGGGFVLGTYAGLPVLLE
jgi:hypothetical protein